MKKVYKKPSVEVELYTLDSSIASNCAPVISFGPQTDTLTPCDEFKGAFDTDDEISLFTMTPTPFYENGEANCNCYYTGGGSTYFTS